MAKQIADFDAWFGEVRRTNKARGLKARRLAAREPAGGLVLCKTRPSGSVDGAAISQDGGQWRVSRFDINGFFGHGHCDTKEQCIRLCLGDGYRDTNRNLLREYSLLDSFHDGNELTTRNQSLMANQES